MNPQIQAKRSAIPVIEQYIQTIPFSNVHYSVNVYADYQTAKEHFCSFWKKELGLTYTDTIELGTVFDHALTTMPPFPDNSPYIILNDQRAISVSKNGGRHLDIMKEYSILEDKKPVYTTPVVFSDNSVFDDSMDSHN